METKGKMEELRERLEKAIEELMKVQDAVKQRSYHDKWSWVELNRLEAKISGVKLALSYLEEGERNRAVKSPFIHGSPDCECIEGWCRIPKRKEKK